MSHWIFSLFRQLCYIWWRMMMTCSKNSSHLHFVHRMCLVTSFYHDEILSGTLRQVRDLQRTFNRFTVISLYLVHGLKNNTMFSECTHTLSPDCMILMRTTGCINWGITSTFSYNTILFFFFNKCKTRRSSQQWEKIEWNIVHVTWLFWHIDGLRDSFQIFAQWDSVLA